jgi:hypothetical protein
MKIAAIALAAASMFAAGNAFASYTSIFCADGKHSTVFTFDLEQKQGVFEATWPMRYDPVLLHVQQVDSTIYFIDVKNPRWGFGLDDDGKMLTIDQNAGKVIAESNCAAISWEIAQEETGEPHTGSRPTPHIRSAAEDGRLTREILARRKLNKD